MHSFIKNLSKEVMESLSTIIEMFKSSMVVSIVILILSILVANLITPIVHFIGYIAFVYVIFILISGFWKNNQDKFPFGKKK